MDENEKIPEEKPEPEVENEDLGASNNFEDLTGIGEAKKKKKHKKKKKKKKNDKKDKKEKKSSLNNDKYIINGNYSIVKMLGFGAFGEIHLAYDTNLKSLRAIKFELTTHKNPQLKHEYSVLEQLNKEEKNAMNQIQEPIGIPKVYYFDRLENQYNFLVMDLLGPSIADLFQLKEKSFSLETVLLCAIQMLTRIEFVHEKGFLHRDIKPENFVIGLNEKSNLIHIIDFGLSKRYKDKNSGQHIPYRENRHLIGTARYASINAHLGIEQSRRDDIESIGYMLVYFYLGRLPWQNKQDKGKPPTNKIMEKKLTTPPEILCKKMPVEFSYYFHYCKNLKFEDRPDYSSLKSLFCDLLSTRINLKEEVIFDWFDEDNVFQNKKKNELKLSQSKSDIDFSQDDIKKKKTSPLNKIDEGVKEDSKEESNIKKQNETIHNYVDKNRITFEANVGSNNLKSSISSASDDSPEKKNESKNNENNNNNEQQIVKQELIDDKNTGASSKKD